MEKICAVIVVLAMMITMLCACQGTVNDSEDNSTTGVVEREETAISEETISEDWETTASTTEPTVSYQGSYTLEDSSVMNGVYIAYDDGSFDRYQMGGYCSGLTSGSLYFYGMYLEDSIAENLPVMDANSNLVVFSDSYYSLSLYPINSETGVIHVLSDDGVEGYGQLWQQHESGAVVSVDYRNNQNERWLVRYIDEKPAQDYPAEKIEWEVTPYKGSSSTVYEKKALGFKNGTTVVFGMAEGSTLVETSYDVDTTYYNCNPEENNWQEEDRYGLPSIPTTDGYAGVDLSGVPSGKYIMLFEENGYYSASILNLENN